MMVLLKKELTEQLRTYRGLVVVVLFVLFGLVSPLLAKALPDLLASLAEGMIIQLPEPTWLDAFQQYFKNLIQMGLLAVILTTMGTVAEEKAKSTALLVLARPVSRHSFVWAKFISLALVLTVATTLSYLACLYYAWVLFAPLPVVITLQATLLFFTYALFIGALTVCASCLTASGPAAGGIALAGFFAASILPSLHRLPANYSPGALTNLANQLMTQSKTMPETFGALAITLLLTLALILGGSWAFSRQEI